MVIRHSPTSLEVSGKNELVIFSLTFLTSTWYIKNPFLKAKIVEVRVEYIFRCLKLIVVLGVVLWNPRLWARAYRCFG